VLAVVNITTENQCSYPNNCETLPKAANVFNVVATKNMPTASQCLLCDETVNIIKNSQTLPEQPITIIS
jgi:hypothetical protein